MAGGWGWREMGRGLGVERDGKGVGGGERWVGGWRWREMGRGLGVERDG